jgi:hypothetical protein
VGEVETTVCPKCARSVPHGDFCFDCGPLEASIAEASSNGSAVVPPAPVIDAPPPVISMHEVTAAGAAGDTKVSMPPKFTRQPIRDDAPSAVDVSASHPIAVHYNAAQFLVQDMSQTLEFDVCAVHESLHAVCVHIEDGGGAQEWRGTSRSLHHLAKGKRRRLSISVRPQCYGVHSFSVYVEFKIGERSCVLESDEVSHRIYPQSMSAGEALQTLRVTINNKISSSGYGDDVAVRNDLADLTSQIDPRVKVCNYIDTLAQMKAFKELELYSSKWTPRTALHGNDMSQALRVPSQPANAACDRLTLRSRGGTQRVHLVASKDVLTLGRKRECDVSLRIFDSGGEVDAYSSKHISGDHMRVRFSASGVAVGDGIAAGKPSTFGLWVDGVRVRPGSETVLEDGGSRRLGLCGKTPETAHLMLRAAVLGCLPKRASHCPRGGNDCKRVGSALLLTRDDDVPEAYALIEGCLALSAVDRDWGNWEVFRMQGGFLAVCGRDVQWLTPGQTLSVGEHTWQVEPFLQFGMGNN